MGNGVQFAWLHTLALEFTASTNLDSIYQDISTQRYLGTREQRRASRSFSLYLLQDRKRNSHGRAGNVEKLAKLWSRDGWAEKEALYVVAAVLS